MHVGTDKDMIEDLKTYGLDPDHLPEKIGGGIKTDFFKNWLTQRMEYET